MANSRIMLACRHCGEQICIGKGYVGSYCTLNTNIFHILNDFYEKHMQGKCCVDDKEIHYSENARDHFVILEEGETLADISDVVEVKRGEWRDNRNGTYTCSVCGGKASKMNWCGCCGAKMDGGKG